MARVARHVGTGNREPGTARRAPPSELRIAWASPLPPTRSGVADYAAELLPELRRHAVIRLVEPPDWRAPEDAVWARRLARLAAQAAPPRGYLSLLHVGNNPYHLWVVRRLRRFGGVVVLHDSVLHHLLVEEAAADGAWDRFSSELSNAHPDGGAALAAARSWGYTGTLDPFLFPARRAYLRMASAAIVHSDTALHEVRDALPRLPLRKVPLAVAALPRGDRPAWRARLGAHDGEMVLVHLGFLTPVKGLEEVLRALLVLVELNVPSRLVVVGEGVQAPELATTLRESGLEDRVVFWGYATREDLGGILAAADLGLVPRYPTAGETSAAALRFMAAGTPVAVSGYAQFLEFPVAAAMRLTPGQRTSIDLVRLVSWLGGDPEALAGARLAASRAWSDGGHAPEQAAAALAAALEDLRLEVA
jgi:glycosyltransferase involved in cell wall biosynthesis